MYFILGDKQKNLAEFVEYGVKMQLAEKAIDDDFTEHDVLKRLKSLFPNIKYKRFRHYFLLKMSSNSLPCYESGKKPNGEKLYRVLPEFTRRMNDSETEF